MVAALSVPHFHGEEAAYAYVEDRIWRNGYLSALPREASASHLAEFDFRYTDRAVCGMNDKDRADIALAGMIGKRLTYRRTNAGA